MVFFRSAALALGVILAAGAATAEDRSGTFEGKSNHVTSGTVTISGHTLTLGDDFSFDGAPDPKLALGKDGVDAETVFAALEADSGTQTYTIPDDIDPAGYDEVWLWCEQFDVPLGLASLN